MWKVLLPYLLGAASAFGVQYLIEIYIVPRVDSRKRREERWEKDVLDLGELLSTSAGQLAGDANAAQWLFQMASSGQWQEGADQLSKLRGDAREATDRYTELIHVRASWLANRVSDFHASSDAIVKFHPAWRRYVLQTLNIEAIKYGEVPEADFEAYWKDDRERRSDLLSQVKALARLRHPPRASWRRQIRNVRRTIAAGVKRKRPELAVKGTESAAANQTGEGAASS